MNEESKEIQQILKEEEFQSQNYEARQQKDEMNPAQIEYRDVAITAFLDSHQSTRNME